MSSKKHDVMANAKANVAEVDQVANQPMPGQGAAKGADSRRFAIKRSKEFASVPIDWIEADPDQPRKTFDQAALAQLAAALKERGQLQPIVVRWVEEKNAFVIVDGERRWRAARIAGMEAINAEVRDKPQALKETRADQLVANLLREDLDGIEESRAMAELMETHGYTQAELAEKLGFKQAKISKALSLLKLTPDVQEKVRTGEISPLAAQEIAKVADPAEQVALAEKAVAENLSAAEVGAEAAKKKPAKPRGKSGKARPAKLPTVRSFTTGDRIKVKVVFTSKKGMDPDALLTAALDVRDVLQAEVEALKAAS